MNRDTGRQEKPKGVMRWFLRMPIWLYRMNLGWILGNRFIMLKHIGRKSGLTRYAVIEVVHFDKDNGIYTVASGWGTQSDWYRNILKTPEVEISTYKGEKKVTAVILPVREGEQALTNYAQTHPAAFRALAKFMLGPDVDSAPVNFEAIA